MLTAQGVLAQGTAASGIVNVFNSTFHNNFASDEGGAVYMESAGVALQDVLMEGNTCAPSRGLGGALASMPRASFKKTQK